MLQLEKPIQDHWYNMLGVVLPPDYSRGGIARCADYPPYDHGTLGNGSHGRSRLVLSLAIVLFLSARCFEAEAVGASTLTSADFTLSLSHTDSSGNTSTLNDNGLKTFFSEARCVCPVSVVVTLEISTDGLSKLGGSSLDAQISVGGNCDNSAASGCVDIGSSLTLSSSKSSTDETLSSVDFFSNTSCGASASSTRVWAIIRVDGSRLDSQPSLAINLGGTGAVTPTSISAKSANGGLLVSWSTTADSSTIQGHQVLCSPGLSSPRSAAFETCSVLSTTNGSGPFATLDPRYICSDLVDVGTDSTRLQGLTNGQSYQIAVVAVGNDGTPSGPSAVATATPNPTYGFDDIYYQNGGTAQSGCAVASGGPAAGRSLWADVLVGVGIMFSRMRRSKRGTAPSKRRIPLALVLALVMLSLARTARADVDTAGVEKPQSEVRFATGDAGTHWSSPRGWNFELRFGPYRPNVDSEFSARGSSARPYQQIFSSSKHLLTQVEVDRHLSHFAGTWALGLNVGYSHASASALASDLVTQTGDETALTVIPVSASVVYRADQLRRFEQIGVVPFAKIGLDYAYWNVSDTAKTGSTGGRTLGWHAAAGLSLDLSSFDPDAARLMDMESGVNQVALFVEVCRYGLDGFGSGSVLHLSDTTWSGGLMLEF